ncbi:DUF4864 domain-containing protein [Qingshengfaniella alkalisoli]|uniref:DUF4864 domain-containing protein n=1 Tax=Qingshengfaniella alkalisoli TaxID=2599296 RepID=A0A5B8IRJ8_9RHOB|nr:DUF4864 domain-containing protein [Qingshengfaniella alkalisoli]QDY68822.1 DUF4864 domain-containing protein [Qingshengfaniella alkalisoli]
MRHLFLALIFSALSVTALRAQSAEEAIPSVIQKQIDAFLTDDLAEAFSYASPGIKSIFETPERFGAMVLDGYPMVWRPDDVTFLELDDANRQRVLLQGQDGRLHLLEYDMIQTPDGWQIDGVRLLQPPRFGA